MEALASRPELGSVDYLASSVAQENLEAQAMLRRAGFAVGPDLNEYEELRWAEAWWRTHGGSAWQPTALRSLRSDAVAIPPLSVRVVGRTTVRGTGRVLDMKSTHLVLVPLTPELVGQAEPWFDDADTRRFLGDRGWIRRELELVRTQPGTEFHGRRVTGRYAWLVHRTGGEFVAFVGAESYDDGSAAVSIVVAPEARGRRLAAAILRALDDQPELSDVDRFLGGLEPANEASWRAVQAAGFRVADETDDEGILNVERLRGT